MTRRCNAMVPEGIWTATLIDLVGDSGALDNYDGVIWIAPNGGRFHSRLLYNESYVLCVADMFGLLELFNFG